jgi:hypothetical protein
LILTSTRPAAAQESDRAMDMSAQTMPGMAQMGEHQMQAYSLIDSLLQHATSGTNAEPNSTPFSMLMTTKGKWALMFHGEAFLSEQQQTGPRGFDKLFSTNWWMSMAQRKLGATARSPSEA